MHEKCTKTHKNTKKLSRIPATCQRQKIYISEWPKNTCRTKLRLLDFWPVPELVAGTFENDRLGEIRDLTR